MWFNLAASAGNVEALQGGDDIAHRMTPGQIIEAQKLVRDWTPKTNY
jgi:hypothetical protein